MASGHSQSVTSSSDVTASRVPVVLTDATSARTVITFVLTRAILYDTTRPAAAVTAPWPAFDLPMTSDWPLYATIWPQAVTGILSIVRRQQVAAQSTRLVFHSTAVNSCHDCESVNTCCIYRTQRHCSLHVWTVMALECSAVYAVSDFRIFLITHKILYYVSKSVYWNCSQIAK